MSTAKTFKERGILFSAPMVRALLAGTKTQTRRIVKPQPDTEHDGEPYWSVGGYRAYAQRGVTDPLRMGTNNPLPCPYGVCGDRLWVREAHEFIISGPHDVLHVVYKADGTERDMFDAPVSDAPKLNRSRPSIHMPRWASRITLEVTGVRVERLNDISEADGKAEGLPAYEPDDAVKQGPHWYRASYLDLWESINGKGSWDANPWVWCVTFKRVPT